MWSLAISRVHARRYPARKTISFYSFITAEKIPSCAATSKLLSYM
jgi:hypothetical protein